MGAKNIDLGKAMQPLMDEMKNSMSNLGANVQIDVSGTADRFETYEVASTDPNFELTRNQAGNANMSMDMNVSGPSGSGSGDMNMKMSYTSDGKVYFSEDKYALEKVETNADISMDMNIDFSSGQGSMTMNLDINGSGDLQISFEPALNMFDFPIKDGDMWDYNGTISIQGSVSGKVKGKISIPGFGKKTIDNQIQRPIDTSINVSTTFEASKTTLNGSTVYAIDYTSSGGNWGISAQPLTVGVGTGTIYYSLSEEFIVKREEELSLGNRLFSNLSSEGSAQTGSLNLSPFTSSQKTGKTVSTKSMSFEEAKSSIANTESGGGGIPWLMTIGIITRVIVVIIVVAVIRGGSSGQETETYSSTGWS